MLRFLLDEHISATVCSIVRERRSDILIESLLEWRGASLRGKDDDVVLTAASEAGFTLVSYDLRTIPPLLRVWAAQGRSHGGVVFSMRERTVRRTWPGLPRPLCGFGIACTRSNGGTALPLLRDPIPIDARAR